MHGSRIQLALFHTGVVCRRGVGACPYLLLGILSQDCAPACDMPHGTLVLGVIPVLSLLRHTRLLVESEIKITSLFLAIPRVLCTTPFGIIFVVEDFSPIPSLFLFLSAFVFHAWASVSKSCLEHFLACHPVSHEARGDNSVVLSPALLVLLRMVLLPPLSP